MIILCVHAGDRPRSRPNRYFLAVSDAAQATASYLSKEARGERRAYHTDPAPGLKPVVATEHGERRMSSVEAPSVIKVKMGGVEFARAPDVLETLLGSCVGVAVWDRQTKQGGLAHVVLPDSHGDSRLPGKFADTAVAELRRQLIARGCPPGSLCAKVAGGSTMFGKRSDRDVGEKNHRAVIEHLRKHGIRVAGEHIGGDKGRIIRFVLDDGRVDVTIARQLVKVL